MNEDDLLDNDFDEILNDMLNNWPSPFVARNNIQEFTCGLYKPSTLKTMDSKKCGPKRVIKIGKKALYFVGDVLEWLKGKRKESK